MQLQLANGEEAVAARLVVEIDHARAGIAPVAGGVAIVDRDTVADQAREVLVVLQHRAAEIMDGQRAQRFVDGRGRQIGIEADAGRRADRG